MKKKMKVLKPSVMGLHNRNRNVEYFQEKERKEQGLCIIRKSINLFFLRKIMCPIICPHEKL